LSSLFAFTIRAFLFVELFCVWTTFPYQALAYKLTNEIGTYEEFGFD